ncbi:unnamed protein product, partial [Prorocentrum cordatum]
GDLRGARGEPGRAAPADAGGGARARDGPAAAAGQEGRLDQALVPRLAGAEGDAGAGSRGHAVLAQPAHTDAAVSGAEQVRGLRDREILLPPLEHSQGSAKGARHPSTLVALTQLATVCWHLGKYGHAEQHLRTVLQLRRAIGESHEANEPGRAAEVATALNLARVLQKRGQLISKLEDDTEEDAEDLFQDPEAEKLFEEVLAYREAKLGSGHQYVLAARDEFERLRTSPLGECAADLGLGGASIPAPLPAARRATRGAPCRPAGIAAARAYERGERTGAGGAYEEELQDMESDAARAEQLKADETTSAMNKIITTAFHMVHLINFFTSGPDETRAWTIRKGFKAPQAAGCIHTDFEKKFIMAEVQAFSDLKELGSEAAVKAAGKYRQEGKNYEVQDGDVIFYKIGK